MLFRDVLFTAASGGGGAAPAIPETYSLKNSGVTTWFNAPPAIANGGYVYAGSMGSNVTGGQVQLDRVKDGEALTIAAAHNFGQDDHNNGVAVPLAGGKLAYFYSGHDDTHLRYRVSLGAMPEIGAFDVEKTVSAPAGYNGTAYVNAFRLGDYVYVFQRGTPSAGTTFSAIMSKCLASKIEDGTAVSGDWTRSAYCERSGHRAYLKPVQNGADRVDFFFTDGHPNAIVTSLYHFYMVASAGSEAWYKSDGTQIVAALPFDIPTEATTIIDDDVRWWNWDIRIGEDGHPRCLSARFPTVDGGAGLTDIQYWHHRWTGSAWVNTQLASNQKSLYVAEPYYAGGLCFDGNDTGTIYSAELSGSTYELYQYSFDEGTATRSLAAQITTGSTYHNFRPFSAADHGDDCAVLWSYGSYTSYTNLDTNILAYGVIPDLAEPVSYEAETTALVARISTPPTTTRKININEVFRRLKTGPASGSDILAKLDALKFFANQDQQSGLLDWKSASWNCTVTGTPVFAADGGVKGDGTTGSYWAGPGPSPFSQYTQNSAMVCAMISPAISTGTGFAMRRTAASPFILIGPKSANFRVQASSGGAFTTVSTAIGAVWLGNRSAAGAVQFYKNGLRFTTANDTEASQAIQTDALVYGYQADFYVQAAAIGSKLTAIEQADLTNVMNYWRKAVAA